MELPRIIANWKMEGTSESLSTWVKEVAERVPKKIQKHCLFCPPACYLSLTSDLFKKHEVEILLGSQNLDSDNNKPLTGGISASMLSDLGCKFVIVGHSERRLFFREDEEILSSKIYSALKNGLMVIYCVGENREEKNFGKSKEKILEQLKILKDLKKDSILIAYEPVWAIGTGESAEKKDINEMHELIKKSLSDSNTRDEVYVAYGGSLDVNNSESILGSDYVDGLLIGGASLDANKFCNIAQKS